jgi:hypothetical protein
MAQSKLDKGFTTNKFPAFSGTWNQNHVNWLVAKFGDRVGEVKASDVRKKGSSKITNEKYRELLELVVKSKQALCNGKLSIHNKYAIYFNVNNSKQYEKEDLFDKELILHPAITNLPPRFGLMYIPKARELESWVKTKMYWTCFYQLICSFQNEGKPDLKSLPNWLPRHVKKGLELDVKEYICIYKLIKFSWEEIEKYFNACEYNHNDFFIRLLQTRSLCELRLGVLTGNYYDRPRSQYEYLRQLHRFSTRSDGEPLSERDKKEIYKKFLGDKVDIYFNTTERGFFSWLSICLRLKELLKVSDKPFVREVLADWKAIEQQQKDAHLAYLNLLKDKPRHAKYMQKAIKKQFLDDMKILDINF